jgi:L-alanine-DL-glutamate epimerase-like enolase superfamily enzyme
MALSTDIRPIACELFLLPIRTRTPLKFGPEVTTEVTCARVKLTVADRRGKSAVGWGETPLSVQWVWPSALSYKERLAALLDLTGDLARFWGSHCERWGHPMEIGHAVIHEDLPRILKQSDVHANSRGEAISHLASLVCNSPFDLALHDAYGILHDIPTYDTYHSGWMSKDLSYFLEPAERSSVSFAGRFPEEYLVKPPPTRLRAWHLIGGKDPIEPGELDGTEPNDGEPVLLRDWIDRDGLKCLKVKLRGDDSEWDDARMRSAGRAAIAGGVEWLSADFNCTVRDPEYVNAILDRLAVDEPTIFDRLLYVEQPFPYDLEANPIDVHSVSRRKPLFMDESAHDWTLIRLGRELGWNGVALKTCKTQTGAILSLCWAKAHGMALMVQDLTNPMLAQIPHVLLAAHAGTIQGVESNSMQFYPEASRSEEAVHPGLFRRRNGELALDSIRGPGFGMRVAEIDRALPDPVCRYGAC